MKIIKEGTAHLPWTKTVECKKCDSILIVSEDDLIIGTKKGFDRNESYDITYCYYVCPVCNVEQEIKKTK